MKMLPIANRANDLAPAATVCCNACRSCLTTNIIGAGIAAVGAVALGVRGLARRVAGNPS